MNEFYQKLQDTIDKIRETNVVVIIMVDWNSRVGKDHNEGMGRIERHGEGTRIKKNTSLCNAPWKR